MTGQETGDVVAELRRAVAAVVEREVAGQIAELERSAGAAVDTVDRLAALGYLDAGTDPVAGGIGLAGEAAIVRDLAAVWGALGLAVVPALLHARACRPADPEASAVPAGLAVAGAALDVRDGDRVVVSGRLGPVVAGGAGRPVLVLPAPGPAAPGRAVVLGAVTGWEDAAYDGFRGVPFPSVDLSGGTGAVVAGSAADGARLAAAHQVLLAAVAAGLAAGALEAARRYVVERRQFGRSIGSFGEIQDIVAGAAASTAAAAGGVQAAAAAWDAGRFSGAATAFLHAADAAVTVCDRMQHAHGGYGHMAEYPVGRFVRDARMVGALAGPRADLRKGIAVAAGLPDHLATVAG